jgi:hypothetical protein
METQIEKDPELIKELDQLRLAYKTAVDEWVAAIREEEGLAIENHSMTAAELWDQAGFREQDAQKRAVEAKEAYKDALRKVLYNF